MTVDSNDRNVYFAAKPADDAVKVLYKKSEVWFNTLNQNNYLEKVRRCWMAYHGAYYSDVGTGHSIVFEGEQGELANMPVNDFRNIARHILTMVTANRPAFRARSTNTDYKSLVQTKLANGLLDYYMRERRLERYLKRAVEYAIVMGSGYIKMEWNPNIGDEYDYDEDTGETDRQGDVEFDNLSPFDVVFDSSKETSDNHNWTIVRTFKNRFDIMAQYPEHASEIRGLDSKSDITKHTILSTTTFEETDDIPVYEFFHKRTESMPEGRHMIYLDDDIVLMDSDLPYRDLPIYRIAPADILGTPYGYSEMFDLIPIQDALNSIYSTILTNQNAFGVQNLYVPRGADIAVNQLHGGLNVIEGNSEAGKPEALQLTATAPETFNFVPMLEQKMETLSGINSVARGNPEASLKSGNALALIQSQALQFMSGLQQSYIQLIEDVGTGLINLLRDFADVPRVAAIVGHDHKTHMKEFTGDDLSTVNRVIVDVGNALANSTAGKVQIAESMLQMGVITSPEQYFQVINTGNLDTMTDSVNNELLLIKAENERLVDGQTEVIAVAIDNHSLHIREHKAVLADPDLRNDVELVRRTLEHIQEHINLLRETDPDLLSLMGQQPLGPAGGSPIAPEGGQPSPEGMGEGMPQMVNPEAGGVQSPTSPLPQPARPPGEFAGAPVTAQEMPLGG